MDQSYTKYRTLHINSHLLNILSALPRKVTIQVDREQHFQNITGLGGSLTGAVSCILDKLSQDIQDHIHI